jgi:hypothetical protein
LLNLLFPPFDDVRTKASPNILGGTETESGERAGRNSSPTRTRSICPMTDFGKALNHRNKKKMQLLLW